MQSVQEGTQGRGGRGGESIEMLALHRWVDGWLLLCDCVGGCLFGSGSMSLTLGRSFDFSLSRQQQQDKGERGTLNSLPI